MTASRYKLPFALALLFAFPGCQKDSGPSGSATGVRVPPRSTEWPLPQNASPQLKPFLASAVEQTGITTDYDPAYVRLDYPGGDVPPETGVCSDVIVRAFRKAGIDLQKEVHEDMRAAWSAYPQRWGNTRPDSNIDHRRVLNLMTFFERQNKALAMTTTRADYLPGDVVAWDLGGGVPHIGIVSNLATESPKHFLIIHNIGAGTRAEDVLFNWKITGHYRYFT
ncbi:MAG: DUF1287 domain-containing protein [Acidobacteriota bacterium]|nr:DUF1287 domain-containing protein [Acidobacteriota bacterium]